MQVLPDRSEARLKEALAGLQDAMQRRHKSDLTVAIDECRSLQVQHRKDLLKADGTKIQQKTR